MKNKKALVVTSVASMVDQFLMPSIRLLSEMGYETTVCCNYEKGSTCDAQTIKQLKQTLSQMGIECIHIDFDRKLFGIPNHLRAYRQLKQILKDNHYDLIHCHSPIGGLLTRIAVPRKHNGTKVIYTAHGFHFYKGAPVFNWMLLYPMEKMASRNTDVLITINTEDYELAQRRLRAKENVYIPGVGIEIDVGDSIKIIQEQVEPIKQAERNVPCAQDAENAQITFRQKLGLQPDEKLFLSVGELNKNKNHIAVLKALAILKQTRPDLKWKYVICGQGNLRGKLAGYIESHQLGNLVTLAGFTNEVPQYLSETALFIHPSYREGLSVALMEAIAAERPVICSDIRGNRDLVVQEALFDPGDPRSIAGRIENFFDQDSITKAAVINKQELRKCSVEKVTGALEKIYAEI